MVIDSFWWFLVVLIDLGGFLGILGVSLRFLVVLGCSWLFLFVLCWLLVVLDGS